MYGISLFGNIGIAELGLKNSKVNIVAYSELEQKRADFYGHVFPDVKQFVGDINERIDDIVDFCNNFSHDIDFILATPPCQGSSIAGQRKKNDPRNLLIISVVESIRRINPRYTLIENVPIYFRDTILINEEELTIEEYLQRELSDDYIVDLHYIDAADFGVPQHRKRTFAMLTRRDSKYWTLPRKIKKQKTVRDAIGHLESLMPACHDDPSYTKPYLGKGIHQTKAFAKRHLEAMLHTPEGKSAFDNEYFFPKRIDGKKISGFKTTYKRMSWDKPAPTITMANNSISSQNNVHPGKLQENGLWSDPRTLTLKEIMIIMTIPLDWKFPKEVSSNQIRQYIGEGIPPKLIRKLINNIPERDM